MIELQKVINPTSCKKNIQASIYIRKVVGNDLHRELVDIVIGLPNKVDVNVQSVLD